MARLPCGVAVEATAAQDICDAVDATTVSRWFRDTGLVLFRGFDVDDSKFERMARLFSDEFRTHGVPARAQVGDDQYLTTANPGTGGIHFHAELSYLPEPPHVLWFCCMTPPADDDGETLVCDGLQLWSALDDAVKAPFLSKKIRYSAICSPPMWQRYFEVQTIPELTEKLAGIDGISHRMGAGDRLFLTYVTSAAHAGTYAHGTTFANSILQWGLDGLHEALSFDDGSTVPKSLLGEIQSVADRLTMPIRWRRGDLVMIDNTRVMHARKAFTSRQRRLHVRMGRTLTVPN